MKRTNVMHLYKILPDASLKTKIIINAYIYIYIYKPHELRKVFRKVSFN